MKGKKCAPKMMKKGKMPAELGKKAALNPQKAKFAKNLLKKKK